MSDAKKGPDLDALEAEHKRIGCVRIEETDQIIVFRKPKRAEYDSWMDSDKKQKNQYRLAIDCLLFPSEKEFKDILEEFPAALGSACVECILGLAGVGKAKATAR